MKLIVGLGNPGKKYEKTRHNLGFILVDYLANQFKVKIRYGKFNGLYGKGKIGNETVIFAKPLTYMNNSGNFISQMISFFKLSTEDLLVLYDDKDIKLGRFKLKNSGSNGGHNGLESIIKMLPLNNFYRLKIGIGYDKRKTIKDYVLGQLTVNELKKILVNFPTYQLITTDFIVGKDYAFLTNKYHEKNK